MAEPLSPFTKTDKGIRVSIRLTPNAAKDRVDGIVADADGNGILRIAVTVVPEQGRANKVLIKFLAKQWRFPKSSLSVVLGAKDRNKVLNIEDHTTARYAYLQSWSQQLIRRKV